MLLAALLARDFHHPMNAIAFCERKVRAADASGYDRTAQLYRDTANQLRAIAQGDTQ